MTTKPKEYEDYPKMSIDDFLELPFVGNVSYKTLEEGKRFRIAKTAYSGQLSSVYVILGVVKENRISVFEETTNIKELHYRKDMFGIEKS